MFCEKCGTNCDENTKFCPECGTPTGNIPPVPQPPIPTKYCRHCKQIIPKNAKVCYICHKKQKSNAGLYGLLVLVIIMAACIKPIIDNDPEVKRNNELLSEKHKQEEDSKYISLEEFNQIEIGMTYDEVVSIVGCEGKLQTETVIMDYNYKTYDWNGKGLANASIMFCDGKVDTKSQYGLE